MDGSTGGWPLSATFRLVLLRQLEAYIYAPASGGTSISFATFEPNRGVWPVNGVAVRRPKKD